MGKMTNCTVIQSISIIPHIIPEKAAYLLLRKMSITDIVFVNPLATNNAIPGNKKSWQNISENGHF